MLLLRFILVFALLYYLLKLFFRWIVGSSARKGTRRWRADTGRTEQRYDELTDQKIEDAEYEEFS
jgi:hypothetical protein